jgi:hypothetical protein
MFTPKRPIEPTALEKAIDRLHDDMQTVDPNTEKYSAMADNLIKLYKLREHDTVTRWRPSPDVVLTVAANLIGIVIIIKHEEVNVISSKALGFVKKLG